MKTWLDYPGREDLRLIPAMVAKGWEPIFDTSDKEVSRITPDNPPFYEVSFHKGNKTVFRNKKRGQWHGIENDNIESKHTIYLTLNDVLYGESII